MNRFSHRLRLSPRAAGVAMFLLLAFIVLLLDRQSVSIQADSSAPAPTSLPSVTARVVSTEGTPVPLAGSRPLDSLPDLAIQSVTMQPSNPSIGQPVTITVAIKNVGATTLWDGFYTYLYTDPPERPPLPTTPDTNYVGWFLGLEPGATFRWSYTNYVFDTAGCDHVVYAWVDRDDAIREEDENNNLATLDVCISDGSSTGDTYEPDDLCDDATFIESNGTAQEHTFAPVGDIDWVKFTGIGGVQYRVEAQDLGAGSDVAMELRSRCSQTPTFGNSKIIDAVLPTDGTYYIRMVNHSTGSEDTSYRISVTARADCSSFFEPNDARSTAKDIEVNAPAQRHQFCRPDDTDWVKFAVQAGVNYHVQAVPSGGEADPTIAGIFGDDQSDLNTGNPIQFTAVTDGVYYVRVFNQPASAFGAATEYDLAVTSTNCTADAFEPDNSLEQAVNVTINGLPDSRTACPANDRDWVRFSASAGITYTLESTGIGAASDTILCLYDNLGTEIACDDEGGANHGSRLTWQATVGGDYFAELRQADTDAAGPSTEYEFSIVTGLCRPDLYEPDDSAEQAESLTGDGAPQSHNFCPSNDRDWVRFQAPAAGWYTFQTGDLAPGSDTLVRLYATDQTTLLAENDDFALGTASQLSYDFPAAGTYYLEIQHFNPLRYGRSTTYSLSATAGQPTPTSTPPPSSPTPTPTPSATPTPPPSGVRTLILTNQAQFTTIYGAERTAPLMEQLATLANHREVQGEVVDLAENASVSAAFAAWNAEPTSVEQANQTAGAVRSLAMGYLATHPSVRYIVLVGDDRVVPAYRIQDRTSYPESEYTSLGTGSSVGAALANDYFLSDDYYADRDPSSWQGIDLYIPDWAVGRLIETPEEIIHAIDAFVASPELILGSGGSKALVVGYDFVQDAATNIATELLGRDLGNAQVDGTLIGDTWTGSQLKSSQLEASPAYKLQSINGHASHASQGAPVGSAVTARDVAFGSSDLIGALIYSVGCHAGLNVPETVDSNPLDLAQAFSQKGANYVGNTGFGWGSRVGVYLSERLMQNYTQELLKGASTTIGEALVVAKQRYFQEAENFGELDEKVLQEVVLYGFPMHRVTTGAVLGEDDEFPSAAISSPFGGDVQAAGQSIYPATAEEAGYGPVRIQVTAGQVKAANTAGFQRIATEWGSYFQLDGHTSSHPLGPVQPRVYANLVPPEGQELRGAIFTGGSYITTTVDPVIAAPMNEYVPSQHEPSFDAEGFYPAVPFVLHANDTISSTYTTLSVVLGQTAGNVQRLYTDVQYDVYFSALDDAVGPDVSWIDGYYNTQTSDAAFKVEATDALTVTRVLIAYSTDTGEWTSFDLAYDVGMRKWVGMRPGIRGAQYSVQAVDSAGNATAVTRKGGYFQLEDAIVADRDKPNVSYLPMIIR